ncbi:hypothetical protein [Clostridium diolis]|uniref:hypothetical protein n=1 Tax=Clostridium diolis TaxID=223919 RepID=UPI003AF6B645
MKKGLRKLLCALIVGASILSTTCIAYATGDAIASKNVMSFNTSSGNLTWYFDSRINSWRIHNNEQGLGDCWIFDNGKWYFISQAGVMVKNTVVYDSKNSTSYYMQEDGSMLTNGYCTLVTGSGGFKWKAYADAAGKLTPIN